MLAFLLNAWRLLPVLAGMALISTGAAFIYLPAGLIAAGLLVILAVIDSRL